MMDKELQAEIDLKLAIAKSDLTWPNLINAIIPVLRQTMEILSSSLGQEKMRDKEKDDGC